MWTTKHCFLANASMLRFNRGVFIRRVSEQDCLNEVGMKEEKKEVLMLSCLFTLLCLILVLASVTSQRPRFFISFNLMLSVRPTVDMKLCFSILISQFPNTSTKSNLPFGVSPREQCHFF